MNISDVAKKTGLTSKAIRFYEEKGLVTPPLRSENGYRTYSQQHLDELTLPRLAQQRQFIEMLLTRGAIAVFAPQRRRHQRRIDLMKDYERSVRA